MSVTQVIFGSLLVLVLTLLPLLYGRRQFAELRRLREGKLPDEEYAHERNKALRRLVSCALGLLMGVLLAVQLVLTENDAERFAIERQGLAADEAPPFTEAQKQFLRVWGWIWVAFLISLMLIMILAMIDFLAVRAYGWKQFRKLQADRRAMIERQTARMREGRD